MDKRWLFIVGVLLFSPVLCTGQSLQLADSLFSTGQEYDDRGNMAEAEFYYQEAYNLYREFRDTTSWLKAGKEYASAMVYRSKNEQAMELYKTLVEVDHPANDSYSKGDIYNSMGWAYKRRGKLDQALRYYHKSLPLSEASGDSLLIGVVYSNLGNVYSSQGNNTKALEQQKKALPYFEGLGRKRNISTTLGNIGGIYREMNLYDQALEYFKKSLDIRKELGDIFLLANSYSAMGSLQRELGNYDQALVAYKQALDNSRQASTPKLTATILNNLGLLYKNLNEYDKAIDYYRQSLAIREQTSGPRDIALTTNNIGQLFWAQEKKEEAADYYHKALKLRRQVGNPHDIASSLNAMLRLTIDQENFEQASAYAEELKAMGDSTDSYDMLQKASTYMGRIDRVQNRDAEALAHFKKAYSYSQFLSDRRQLSPLKDLASQYHKLSSDSAVVYGQKAIDIIEEHRSNAGALSSFKSGYFGKHSDFYTQLASWVLTYTSDVSRAYKLVEQAKARSLSDELAKASQNIEERLPEKVRVERSQKRNRIDRLYTQLESTVEASERTQINDKIREAELEYAAYENNLHQEYTEFKNLAPSSPISLQQAQQINDDETAVLEYAVADDQLMMFLISRDDVWVEQFSPADEGKPLPEQLTSWVTDFKDAILSNASRTKLRAESNRLYEVLLKPFEDNLEQFSNLIIVPDGALAYLPFEAISQGDQYLVENFRIKYEPSLTSLTLLKEPEPINRKDLLAVAGSQLSEGEGQSMRGNQFSALPSTLIEVDSIAAHFKQVSMLKEERVSEQALKNMLRQNRYQYIHLATHGVIDENNPNRSGLALTSRGEVTASSKEDGMLRSSEIFGMDIESDMVVLSACNTGLGKVVGGEGMLGMQRSFFYAGTSTVVVSLWNVYDRSTASFMNEFYKALLQSKSDEGWLDSTLRWVGWENSIPFGQKAAAMRQAKLQMIKHPLFNHPIYWAPFIVVGR